jgi:hypothetical protein
MNWVNTDSLRDRAAIQVEICRLRRIEAKADTGMREAIVRRIQELQGRLHGPEFVSPAGSASELRTTA